VKRGIFKLGKRDDSVSIKQKRKGGAHLCQGGGGGGKEGSLLGGKKESLPERSQSGEGET